MRSREWHAAPAPSDQAVAAANAQYPEMAPRIVPAKTPKAKPGQRASRSPKYAWEARPLRASSTMVAKTRLGGGTRRPLEKPSQTINSTAPQTRAAIIVPGPAAHSAWIVPMTGARRHRLFARSEVRWSCPQQARPGKDCKAATDRERACCRPSRPSVGHRCLPSFEIAGRKLTRTSPAMTKKTDTPTNSLEAEPGRRSGNPTPPSRRPWHRSRQPAAARGPPQGSTRAAARRYGYRSDRYAP